MVVNSEEKTKESLALLWWEWSVKNKTCFSCQRADCDGKTGKNHECYIPPEELPKEL